MRTMQFLLVVALMAATSLSQGQDPLYVDETASRLPLDSQMGVRADTGDVDKDGDIDIIVANGQHSAPPVIPLQNVMLQLNDGNGFFTDGSTQLPPSAFGQQLANAVILGDIDGDGDLDAYVANGSSGGELCPSLGSQNLLWINDGNGNYIDETFRLPGNLDCSFDATFGDIDGDEDLDIVVANVGWGGLGEINRVLINDGNNPVTFSDGTVSAFPYLPSDITYTVALGDLDGDNDLDMVVGNAPDSVPLNRFLENNGLGVFTDTSISWTGAPPYAPWPRPVWDVKLADMNGDGSLDVLMSDASSQHLRMILMLNQGGWLFTNQTIYVSYQYGLDVADVDSDGDTDILVTQAIPAPPIGYGGISVRLLLNSGASSPTFTDVTWGQLPEFYFWDTISAMIRFPKFVDVNDDDAVDIYLPTLVWWWMVEGQAVEDFQDRLLMNTLIPETGELEVAVDIKPTSCPNPFNVGERGLMPVAILGADQFDVTQIDPASIRLADVAPLRWAYEDVTTPFEPYLGKQDALECSEEGADGFLDITFKYDALELATAIGAVEDGDVRVLQITGNLREDFGGTPFVGEDVVVILKKR